MGRRKKKGQICQIWKRYCRNKLAVVGLVILGIVLVLVIGTSIFGNYQNAVAQDLTDRYANPGLSDGVSSLFGKDQVGRSTFWRILFGGRITLIASLTIVFLSMVLGGMLGAVAGFSGGKVDNVIMRTMDMILCIPSLLLAMTIVTALGTSLVNLVIALTIATIAPVARVVRSSVLTVRGQDYIEAATACGSTKTRTILVQVLPNAIGPIIVLATLLLASQILSLCSLSFLGMGTQPPTPEWGLMVSDAKQYLRTYPILTIVPSIAIILSVVSINLIGDGIQDAIDPTLKR